MYISFLYSRYWFHFISVDQKINMWSLEICPSCVIYHTENHNCLTLCQCNIVIE